MAKYDKSVYRTLALITQLGINMLVPIFLCIFIGGQLEKHFSFPFTVIFLILGIMAGFRNTFKMAKEFADDMSHKGGKK